MDSTVQYSREQRRNPANEGGNTSESLLTSKKQKRAQCLCCHPLKDRTTENKAGILSVREGYNLKHSTSHYSREQGNSPVSRGEYKNAFAAILLRRGHHSIAENKAGILSMREEDK
eukprot:11406249-Ditylum_brightwellii.AAC.1